MHNIGRINSIQGLRGIAALLVVADHSILRFLERANAHPSTHARFTYVAETLGRHGVEIFFLISGFIMTVTSYDDFTKPNAASRFLWRRIIRIVPLYWLISALVVIQLLWDSHPPALLQVFKSLAFIPYVNEAGNLQPLLRRGWTLNYEMFFYGLFALALIQAPRRGLTAVIAILVALTAVGQLPIAQQCAVDSCRLLAFYLEPIMLYFAGGIALGVLRVILPHRRAISAIPFHSGLALALVFTAVYVVYVSYATPSHLTYVVGVIFCILTAASCALLEDRPEHKGLGLLFLIVGEASYSIYLTHSVFVDAASKYWTSAVGGVGFGVYLAAMIVGTSLIGILMFRYVETPMLKALKRL